MSNKRLAQWLQEHFEMLGPIENEPDNPFHIALYEGIIDMALAGEARMLDSVVESAATHAVATNRSLPNLLEIAAQLRQKIWQRISEEIDPEPACGMLSAVDAIFMHIIQGTIAAYQEGMQLAQAARAAEISRLYYESERKVMEYATEVSRANRDLARLEQAKTDFISIAAHELKTPLTVIQGYVNFLCDLEPDNEQVASLAQRIRRGTERMARIVDEILDVSAIDMKRLDLTAEPLHLNSTLHLVAAQHKPTLQERRQTLSLIGLEVLPPLQADPRRIHQIFKHLIGNAIKYTPDGGEITVSGQSEPGRVRITIKDTGVGIAPEDLEKVFEKFYRVGDSKLHSSGETKFMGAGPGLGLAIVKGLVEAHGGRIWAESPGFDMQNHPGSTFVVILPTPNTL